MTRILSTVLMPGALALLFAGTPVLAQNPNYAAGDLVLYFQQEGGLNTVYANLGNAATLYRGTAAGPGAANQINFLDISGALTSAYGAGWATDEKIYAGLAGVWGYSNTSSLLKDGDPHRTLYISRSRSAVGTIGQENSGGWDLTLAGDTAMTSGATNIFAQNNKLETLYGTAVAVSPTVDSFIDNQNPFLVAGQQGNAFGAFEGGVQQVGTAGTFGTFGAAGTVEFALDLYRILAKTSVSGQVLGELRVGSFEGTVTINTAGKVSFISQGTATPLQTWALTFPALDTEAKRLPNADPDNDGLTNLMEFILNGNPGTADTSVAPKLNASGTDFVFSFNRRDDSEASSTVLFQYSSDLTNWNDVTVGASGGVVGAASIAVAENGADPDAISVTLPKTTAGGGKLFGRLKVNQP
jgi:hypothetical protein